VAFSAPVGPDLTELDRSIRPKPRKADIETWVTEAMDRVCRLAASTPILRPAHFGVERLHARGWT
jgi:hypothetical protein